MTKIDIISGFLGAGKTTLIKRLLADALKGEKVVLIENEFGEIGIDGGFLKDSGIVVNEMNAGCICCSLVGDFGKALHDVVDQYAPDRILIEPSGVGKLSDVITAVQNAHLDVTLNSFVTVVDALKAKMYLKNFGEFFQNQVAHAGAILLSRTAECPANRLEEVVGILRGINPHARIVTTPWKELTGTQLLQTMEGSRDLVQEVLDEMDQVLDDMEPPGVSPMKSALTRAFAFLAERADFCSVMLRQGGNRPFILRVQQVVRARCLPQWMQVAGGSSVQLEYYLSFVLAGSIGIIERWVEGGLRESPAQMAALREQFVLQGAAGLLPPVRR